jgi:Chaperone of endosialidase
MKINIIPSVLAILALSHVARAVSPAPDGGYPGGNTAEGQQALLSLTTGTYNTAVGLFSLRSNTEGQFNTAIGAGALLATVGDQLGHGTENTAIGAGALLSNTTGLDNTANGAFALFANTTGSGNTATGVAALQRNIVGGGNTAIGQAALNENTTGSFNTAVGTAALLLASGSSNTVVGSGAGGNVGNANNVICIGQGVAGEDVSDSCYIGNIGGTPQGTGIFVTADTTGPPGTAVKLGYQVSSRRYKEDIKPIDKASEALYTLQPVSFRYKGDVDPAHAQQYGFIAEDVAKVNPDLVVNDSQGKPSTLRFLSIQAMLLNEFLKEHTKVEQQRVTIAELKSTADRQQKEMEVLKAQLKKQTEQIPKVSTQVEISRSATKVTFNNP